MVAQERSDCRAPARAQRHTSNFRDWAIAGRGAPGPQHGEGVAVPQCGEDGNAAQRERACGEQVDVRRFHELCHFMGDKPGRKLHLNPLRRAGGKIAQGVERRQRRLVQLAGGLVGKPGDLALGHVGDDDQELGGRRHAANQSQGCPGILPELSDEEHSPVVHMQANRSGMAVRCSVVPGASMTCASIAAILPSSATW